MAWKEIPERFQEPTSACSSPEHWMHFMAVSSNVEHNALKDLSWSSPNGVPLLLHRPLCIKHGGSGWQPQQRVCHLNHHLHSKDRKQHGGTQTPSQEHGSSVETMEGRIDFVHRDKGEKMKVKLFYYFNGMKGRQMSDAFTWGLIY